MRDITLAQRLEAELLQGRGPFTDAQKNIEYADRYVAEIKPLLDDLRLRYPECFDRDGFLLPDKLAMIT